MQKQGNIINNCKGVIMKKISLILIASAFLVLCSFTKSYKVISQDYSDNVDKESIQHDIKYIDKYIAEDFDLQDGDVIKIGSVDPISGELIYMETREYIDE